MAKPLVAVVGRPNVGKSTFFNRVCGKRIAIVKDIPGVTRDRIYGDAEWCGYNFSLVDTGGLDMKNKDDFQSNITRQAQIAVELADVVIFFVDGKQGLVADDHDVANFLRKFKVPVVLAVNKIDNNEVEKTYEFYDLGLGEPIPISSEHDQGIGDLLDVVISHFKDRVEKEDIETSKIAIIGKPNAGKSSIVNKLLGEERVMVSSIAGTTRDAIDSPFRYQGKDFLLIDTAGIRRKRGIEEDSIESYSVLRAFEAIRRSNVSVLVVDAEQGLSEQDVRIAGFIHEEGKPSVIVINKWDLVEKDNYTMKAFEDKLKEDLKFMDYFVVIYVSALTGQRIGELMKAVEKVLANASHRISTGSLNEILQSAILTKEPPSQNGRRLKIYYMTQGGINPPSFIIFVNDSKLMHFSYLRYLENCIRRATDFEGTPIRLILKGKRDEAPNK